MTSVKLERFETIPVEPGMRSVYFAEATMGRAMDETDRSERLKAALRENLRRRKAQARGRESDKNMPESERRTGGSPEQQPSGAGPPAAPGDKPDRADRD